MIAFECLRTFTKRKNARNILRQAAPTSNEKKLSEFENLGKA